MYKLLNVGAQANVQIREYIADTEDDIATLPDSDPFGSTVFVIETSTTYMKNSAGEYVEIAVPGGSGGGGSNTPFVVTITIDDNVVTADKTFEEIQEEFDMNHDIILLESEDTRYHVQTVNNDDGGTIISECINFIQGDTIFFIQLIYSDGSWTQNIASA